MAALIEAEGVSKLFRQHRRFPGMLGALRTLVTRQFTEVAAVRDVGFAIRERDVQMPLLPTRVLVDDSRHPGPVNYNYSITI